MRNIALTFFIVCGLIAVLVAAGCTRNDLTAHPVQQRLIVLGTRGDTLKNILGANCDLTTNGNLAFITTARGKVYVAVAGGIASCEPQ